jgi:hypothetical protein
MFTARLKSCPDTKQELKAPALIQSIPSAAEAAEVEGFDVRANAR